jgi:hypothetical protein
MTLVAAAVVPAAPLLVPELAGGSADVDAELRACAREAVTSLVATGADLLVVAADDRTGPRSGTWDWAPLGVGRRGAGEGRLPLALAMGAWWLDEVAPDRPRAFLGVDAGADARVCRELGVTAAGQGDLALLAVGDGSARRSEKAPGYYDPRAEPYDDQVERALRSGDTRQLLELDAPLAAELLVQGRAPWQVLAGAAGGGVGSAQLLYAAAPYGVCYFVATWQPTGAPRA